MARRHAPRHEKPPQSAPETLTDIAGTWIFGGYLDPEAPDAARQFLARLWCLPHLDGDAPRGVVFFPFGATGQDAYDAFLDGALALWAPALEHMILKGPSRFERLILAPQAVAAGRLRHGTAEFRAFARALPGGDPPGGAGDRLFLFDARAGDGVASSVLQGVLADAGYAIHDLAQTPLAQAVALIGSASMILTSGSPAEDLVLYAARDTTRIGTLLPSTGDSGADFETLARAYGFGGAHHTLVPGTGRRLTAAARDKLRLQLSVQGFL